MYELLCEIDLCDAEDVRVAKEGKTPCTLSLKDDVATRELPPKGSCRDIITLSRNTWCHNQGMACPTKV